jgi:hypothetical protein
MTALTVSVTLEAYQGDVFVPSHVERWKCRYPNLWDERPQAWLVSYIAGRIYVLPNVQLPAQVLPDCIGQSMQLDRFVVEDAGSIPPTFGCVRKSRLSR